jgi:hypothetical protein
VAGGFAGEICVTVDFVGESRAIYREGRVGCGGIEGGVDLPVCCVAARGEACGCGGRSRRGC